MKPSPSRVLLAVGIGTGLSLLGDSTMYTVLPTHTAEAGITLAGIGIILSANRWVRLALNGPMGVIYDRWRRRPLFVGALFVGALSTALYSLVQSFWPLLGARLLWGLSWAGIWVGGNTIILDVTEEENRGRWMGLYQTGFFLGAASGSFLGGYLTDAVGYPPAMRILAGLTLLGAFVSLIFLPETRAARPSAPHLASPADEPPSPLKLNRRAHLASAVALYGINRLVIAGFLTSTFGLFLLERFGDPVQVFNRSFGVATLTGIGLGVSTLIAMLSAPIFGALSDRLRSRWRSAAAGLFHGTLGFSLLAIGSPLAFLLGVPFVALTSGSNQGLSTTLIGETGHAAQRSRRLGLLFTVGDLTSALGPLVAYALIPRIQIQGVYLLAASLFGLMLILSLYLSFRLPQPTEVEKGSLRALPDPESASRPDPVYRPDE